MKVYIISAALIVFIMFSFIFVTETFAFKEYDAILEKVTENSVNAAALCLDEDSVGEGYIGYNHARGEEKIKAVLDATYHFTDSSLVSSNAHFEEAFTYTTWYFDRTPDGFNVTKYVDGTFVSTDGNYINVSLPNGSTFTPDYPSVVLYVKTGSVKFVSEVFGDNVNGGNGLTALKIYEEKEH